MSDKTYTLHGMTDWKFNFTYGLPKIRHTSGAYFLVTPETTPVEIASAVKNILRTKSNDEAEIESIAQEVFNIDWQAMLVNPYPVAVAPLLNAGPAVQQAISIEQLDKIYNNLETAYYSIKASDPRKKPA